MRVIAGTAKSIRLENPETQTIRPTPDRVREALFSILTPRIASARFLDLFAGTGANGIEALSRGAAWATFVDNAPAALATTKRNLETTGLSARADCHPLTLPAGLAHLADQKRPSKRPSADGRISTAPYDIVFADPPYAFTEYAPLVTQVQTTGLLAPGGTVIVEHATATVLPSDLGPLTETRQARYGAVTLTFF